jgi:hyperosmotically inducible periplasmic protein
MDIMSTKQPLWKETMTKHIQVLLVVLLSVAAAACGTAETEPEPTTPAPAASADNTAVNARDSSGTTATPPDQGENETDLAITAKIRQAVVDDKALSINAQNVKIITNTGMVTLRGPVKSEQEKSAIEAKAKAVAGVTKVDNQLEIEAAK